MSIAVALADLAETAARFGDAAYVLTAGDDGRPHIAHVRVRVDGESIVFTAGRSTRRNVTARPATVVLWPQHEPGGFSLIVDADARPPSDDDDDSLVLVATNAVLHRPA
jgi:hypothetical protein